MQKENPSDNQEKGAGAAFVDNARNSVEEVAYVRNRAIRRVVLLDPSKIQNLDIGNKIIQALHKFKENTEIQREWIRKKTASNQSVNQHPTICNVETASINDEHLTNSFNQKVQSNQVTVDISLEIGFCGFDHQQVDEEVSKLKRLSAAIDKLESTRLKHIYSVADLRKDVHDRQQKRTHISSNNHSAYYSQGLTADGSSKYRYDKIPTQSPYIYTKLKEIPLFPSEADQKPPNVLYDSCSSKSHPVTLDIREDTFRNYQSVTKSKNQITLVESPKPLIQEKPSNNKIVILDQRIIKVGANSSINSYLSEQLINESLNEIAKTNTNVLGKDFSAIIAREQENYGRTVLMKTSKGSECKRTDHKNQLDTDSMDHPENVDIEKKGQKCVDTVANYDVFKAVKQEKSNSALHNSTSSTKMIANLDIQMENLSKTYNSYEKSSCTNFNDTETNINQLSKVKVEPQEPMDAVEYILHCAQSSHIKSESEFEDEENIDADIWRAEDNGIENITANNLHDSKQHNLFENFMPCSLQETVSNQNIQIDHTETQELNFSSHITQIKSEFGSQQLTSTNNALSGIQPHVEEIVSFDPKRRKRKMVGYEKSTTLSIGEITERIRRKIIEKTGIASCKQEQKTSTYTQVNKNNTNEFELSVPNDSACIETQISEKEREYSSGNNKINDERTQVFDNALATTRTKANANLETTEKISTPINLKQEEVVLDNSEKKLCIDKISDTSNESLETTKHDHNTRFRISQNNLNTNPSKHVMLEPTHRKSRRKNTIPEIDKLISTRSHNQISDHNFHTKSLNVPSATKKPRKLTDIHTTMNNINYSDSPSKSRHLLFETSSKRNVLALKHASSFLYKKGAPNEQKFLLESKHAVSMLPPTHNMNLTDNTNQIADSVANLAADSIAQSKQVKRKCIAKDFSIDPKILIANSKEDLEQLTTERLRDPLHKKTSTTKKNFYRCGACKEDVSHSLFVEHLKGHYGVGWKEGCENPINMSSYREVLNSMHQYMTHYKVKSFTCKSCGDEKKSAAGLLIHLQTCLLNAEQLNDLLRSCEFCSKRFLPPALWTHEKTCRSNPEIKKSSKIISCDLESMKRKSAIRASSSLKSAMKTALQPTVDDFIKSHSLPRGGIVVKWRSEIKKFGSGKCPQRDCSFESPNVEDLKVHVKNCVHNFPAGFYCVHCQFSNVDIEVVRSHILENHENHLVEDEKSKCGATDDSNDFSVTANDIDSSDASSDSEIVEKNQLSLGHRRTDAKDPNVFRIMEKICLQIHSDGILYNSFSCPISFSKHAFEYFKPNISRSLKFGFLKSKQVNNFVGASESPPHWFDLEQSDIREINDELFIFVGGPVTNSAWAPLNSHQYENSEYLAVSYNEDYASSENRTNQLPEDTLILVYEIKRLKENCFKMEAKILYAFQCVGPINHLVFLPSGGYAPDINRLGLLAVASCKPSVDVFSLPLNIPSNESEVCKVLDIKPSFTLCIYENMKRFKSRIPHCIRLVWSAVKDHHIICGGFSNGFVGVWNIQNQNNLSVRLKTNTLVPLSFFHAIPSAVCDLALHYLEEEPRWLIVANRMRDLQTYDIENPSNPIPLGKDSFQKSNLSSTVWPLYSENPALALEDDYIEDSTVAFTRSVMNVNFKTKIYSQFSSGVTVLCFNPWFNAFVGGCENGDIFIQKFRTISMENSSANVSPRKFIFFTDVVRLDGQSIPVASRKLKSENLNAAIVQSLDSFKKKYNDTVGLIFGGPITCTNSDKSDLSIFRNTPFSMRPMTRINCISLSSDVSNQELSAIGYNNGLLRIKYLDFKSFS